MDEILFNFHDLAMAFTAFECLIFTALILLTTRSVAAGNKQGVLSGWLLAGFLFCHFLIPLHELVFWGKQFRIWVLDISPNLFFLGSYAYFLDGALLYLFVKSTIYRNFQLKRSDLLHLLPVLAYLLGMLLIFYSKDSALKHQLIASQGIAYSAPYLVMETAGRLLRLLYALAAIYWVVLYTRQLKDEYANLRLSESTWLKLMLASFVLLYGWDCGLMLIKLWGLSVHYFNEAALSFVGIGSYYLNLAVITALIFLRFTSIANVAAVNEFARDGDTGAAAPQSATEPVVDPQLVANLERVMGQERFYTNPEISLEKLAEQVAMPAKKLSFLIKLYYRVNFYEFVNGYRIEEAKRLLADPSGSAKTITHVYLEVGFNSKSVFNTYFKRVVGVTPSRYREQVLAGGTKQAAIA